MSWLKSSTPAFAETSTPHYTLIRSQQRKTLGLQVKKGQVIVRAPFFVDEKFIHAFVLEKSAWLAEKVQQQTAQQLSHQEYGVREGGKVFFNGHEYVVKIQPSVNTSIEIVEQQMVFSLHQRQLNKLSDSADSQSFLTKLLAQQLDSYYKEHALEYLPERLAMWANLTGLTPSTLKIRKYKARWGSCSASGKVCLNTWLLACPKFVIDYVIVHELCHLIHLNHSALFWQLVKQHFPEMELAKQWLKQHQRLLNY
ncbi:M48 family metallopeptidase [Colwellia sp. MEBiC06753]